VGVTYRHKEDEKCTKIMAAKLQELGLQTLVFLFRGYCLATALYATVYSSFFVLKQQTGRKGSGLSGSKHCPSSISS
jgi:hypothetical protein